MAVPADRIRILVLSSILACAGMAWAAARRPLDRARIHALYHDGEFERVLLELAPYGKGECSCGKDDSVFAEKHLAVVLAAAPATRELGRYHMFRMLDLSPRADLLDMYVGEEVDAVFERARKEHDLRAADATAKAPAPAVAAAPATSSARRAPRPIAPAIATAAGHGAAPAVAPTSAPAATPAAESSAPAYSDAWAKVAEPGPKPSSRARPAAHLPASRPKSAKAYTPWDAAFADRSVRPAAVRSFRADGADSARSTPVGSAPVRFANSSAAEAPSGEAAAASLSGDDTSRPAWKQPGMWIGGGVAIAAIAFTLWHAGSDGGGPGKTYAVPASLSKSP